MEDKSFSPRIKRIQSHHNDTFRQLKSLLSGRGIKKAGKTLVFGEKILKELISSRSDVIEALIVPQSFLNSPHAADPLLLSVARWYVLTQPLFELLDIFNTRHPFALCVVPEIRPWDISAGLPGKGCSLLLPFQDPENIGSSIRSAVAFGVNCVVILKEGANPFHPKAIRASAGAVFRISLFSGPSINELPASLPIVALDAEGRDINNFPFPESFGLLPGIEGPGLPEHWKKRAVRIPTTQAVEYLNGSVAFSIAQYVWSRRSKFSLPEE